MKKALKILKRVILVAVLLSIVAIIGVVIWFFYPNKTYEFFINRDIGEYYGVKLNFDNENYNDFVSYDQSFIKDIISEVETIKMKPYIAIETEEVGKVFDIEIFTDDNQYLSISFSETIDGYAVSIGTENNGHWDSTNLDWIGCIATCETAPGDELYNLVKEYKDSHIRNISSEDIIQLSETDEHSWFKFCLYDYLEITNVNKIEDDWKLYEPARFEIEDINGYMLVWHCDSTLDTGDETFHAIEVYDAIIYDEAGNEMSIYDENIKEFMEGLK